jgi:tetratricopeptide (TPR) repeat protein
VIFKKLILYTYFLFSFGFAFGNPHKFDFNENCENAYKQYISFKFGEGERLLNIEKKRNPTNVIPFYIENIEDVVSIFVTEEKPLFEKLKSNKEKRMKLLESSDQNSPYYLLTQAETHLQWAMARVKFEEYTTAALELNRAYRLLKENKKKFPKFQLNNKSLGLLHVLIGTIPDSYKWVSNILGIKGTINQGVSELKSFYNLTYSDSSYFIYQTEATVYLGMVLINYTTKSDEAEKIFERIKKIKNPNPMLTYIFGSIGLKTGRTDEVIDFYTKHRFGKEYLQFYYLDLQLGQAKLNGQDDDAIYYLERFRTNFKGINYVKSCNQYISWYYFLKNDKENFQKYFKFIDGPGGIFVDEDKQAFKNYRNKEIPDKELLRARLLFDGGYYKKSFGVLLEIDAKELHQLQYKLEYLYRLARVYQKLGNEQLSLTNYERTLEAGEKQPYYYAESSAVQLGMYWETKEDFEKAKYYYKRAISVSKHEFKNSLDQKAKAGLSRIEDQKD